MKFFNQLNVIRNEKKITGLTINGKPIKQQKIHYNLNKNLKIVME